MPGSFQKILKNQLAILSTFVLGVLCLISCSKKGSNANAKFIGIYHGSDCSGNALSDLVVNAGPNGSTISITFVGGTGACEKNIQVIGTIDGDKLNFSSQTLNDLCGDVVFVSGSGSLSEHILTIDLTGLLSTSASINSGAGGYCFTGTK